MTAEQRHPAATFSAPRASSATIYFASKPDRATDGRFLEENVKDVDFLTEAELQAGRWSYEEQLDPGTYYVMLRASRGVRSWCTRKLERPQTRDRSGVRST